MAYDKPKMVLLLAAKVWSTQCSRTCSASEVILWGSMVLVSSKYLQRNMFFSLPGKIILSAISIPKRVPGA